MQPNTNTPARPAALSHTREASAVAGKSCGGKDGTPWPSPCFDCEPRLPKAHADWLTFSGCNGAEYTLDWFIERVSKRSDTEEPTLAVWSFWSGWLVADQAHAEEDAADRDE